MTAVLGVLCRDGVLIGTDSSATFAQGSQRTIEQLTEKLRIVGSSMIVASNGQVGLGQQFNRIAKNAYDRKLLSGSDYIEFAKSLSRMAIEDLSHTYLKAGLYGSLIGFHMRGRPRLCAFSVSDFQPEFKDVGVIEDRLRAVVRRSSQPARARHHICNGVGRTRHGPEEAQGLGPDPVQQAGFPSQRMRALVPDTLDGGDCLDWRHLWDDQYVELIVPEDQP